MNISIYKYINALTMSNNPSQNNPTINNTHELNFIDTTNGLNNYSNTLPPMTSQNTNRLNHFLRSQ